MPTIVPATKRLLAMLLRPSPTKVRVRPLRWPNFSLMVIKSAIIWVGCHSSVKPFQTGTPAKRARVSTSLCLKPRYSIPSNMRPITLAVSSTDSFLPNWVLSVPMNSGYAPKSLQATTKEDRVRVEVFSKSRATLLPSRYLCGTPVFFSFFRWKAKSTRYMISAGVKSLQARKLRPWKTLSLTFAEGLRTDSAG